MINRLKARFSDNTRRIAGNSLWEGGQQAFTVLSGALISVMLVLVVPVHEYGVYSYALALLAIGSSVMTAGLNGLAVKALVQSPGENASIVTGLLIIRELLALVGYGVILAVSYTANDNAATAATAIAGLALLSRALDAPEIWYQAQIRSRRTASIRFVVVGAFFVLRISSLILVPSIWMFLALIVLESVLATALITTRYLRDKESPGLSRPDLDQMVKMGRESWPLLLSGVANQINLRGNVVFIQSMIGSSAAGVYAAAARLSEVAYFLPAVVMNSVFPVLLRVRREEGESSNAYHELLQKAYDRAFWLGVGTGVAVGAVGLLFITYVFGSAYYDARPILLIQLASCPFLFMAAVYSKWIVAEGVLWSSLVRHGLGAIVNVLLNMALIPNYGILGSAVAATASYIVASFLACFVGRRSRLAGKQMLLAIIAPLRWIKKQFMDRKVASESTDR